MRLICLLIAMYILFPSTDLEKVYHNACLEEKGYLVEIGGFYLCDIGPDPTPQEGHAK